MATMYELLSQRPHGKPGYRKSGTDRWDGKALEARDYTLPVRRNTRTRIQRTSRQAFMTSSREEKAAVKIEDETKIQEAEEGVEAPATDHEESDVEDAGDDAQAEAEVGDDQFSFESSSAAAADAAVGE